MNDQEVFSKVVRHLFTQGGQARRDQLCVYRGEDGTSCAVGCLIADDIYQPSMEGIGVEALIAEYPTVKDLLSECDSYLLCGLQSAHDRSILWADKRVSTVLTDISSEYHLTWPDEIPKEGW